MAFEISSDCTRFLLCFVAALLLAYIVHNWFKNLSYPPGPIGIWPIGYVPFMTKYPNFKLRELAKKYGEVFSIRLGTDLYTIVSDYKAAKELLQHPLTLGRPEESFHFVIGQGGFVGMNGEPWREQRRFVFQTMRNLGLGKGHWEALIQEDALELVETLKKWKGQPIDVHDPLSISQASNNVSLLIGKHLDKSENNQTIKLLRRIMATLLQYFSPTSVNVTVPKLAKYLVKFRIAGYHTFRATIQELEDFFRKEIMLRLYAKESEAKEDFIGAYIQEMKQREKDTKPHSFTVDHLIGNMILLFIAGNDSTMSSVQWLLLLMAAHQDVQKKIHKEIDDAIGRDGIVTYDDKPKLPYTFAAMLEMQRWASISPFFPPRQVLETFEFRGYTIPKDSAIITNAWDFMHSEKYFKDAEAFKPERFIQEEDGKPKKIEGYGAFSFGKRNCPGEGTALMTIYIYFVSLMQKYRVELPPGATPDFGYEFGGVLHPHRQNLCFVER